MPLLVRREDDAVVLEVVDRFDVVTAPEIKTELTNLITDGARKIVVSLAQVSFIDSSGLGALVSVHKDLEERGGALAIAEPTRQAELVLTITRLSSVLRVFSDVDAALKEI